MIIMASKTSHPYRDAEAPSRGPLTFREKAGAALSGLARLEPLIEVASRGLDPALPKEERLKAARSLARSASTDRIFRHLEGEADPSVQDALSHAFLSSYRREMERYSDALCTRTSAMGAINTVAERDCYSFRAKGQAAGLMEGGRIASREAREALGAVLSS
jgi:hypothetical protein